MSINLNSFKSSSASVGVAVIHPVTGDELRDENGNVAEIFIYGKASSQYKEYSAEALRKALLVRKNAGKVKSGGEEITPEKIRNDAVEYALTMTDKITLIELDGTPLTTKDALRKAFTNPEFYWLYDQVNAAIENDSNFIKA